MIFGAAITAEMLFILWTLPASRRRRGAVKDPDARAKTGHCNNDRNLVRAGMIVAPSPFHTAVHGLLKPVRANQEKNDQICRWLKGLTPMH